MEAVRARPAVGENFVGVEAEFVERGVGGFAGFAGLQFDAAPAVAREIHPFAARLHEQRDLVGGELGVRDAELDGEVEPVAARGLGLRRGDFHVRRERRAEEVREAGRGLDLQPRRKRGVPRDEFIREFRPGVARPSALAVTPLEIEGGEPRTCALRRREIELQHGFARPAQRRGATRGPVPARGDPVLLHRQIIRAREQLRAEAERVGIVGCGGEPALEHGAKRDAANVAFQLGWQTETGGAEARHQPRIAERGGGQRRIGRGRRATPGPVFEKVERLGLERDEHGARGGTTVGRHEAQFEPIARGGGDGRLKREGVGLDGEWLPIRQHDRVARGAGAEEVGRGVERQGLAQRGGLERRAAFRGEREAERGLRRREMLEVRGPRPRQRGEPTLRRGTPPSARDGAHLDREAALGAHAGAQAGDVQQRGMRGRRRGCAGLRGVGERALPRGEFLLHEMVLDRRGNRGGVGERTKRLRDRAARELVVVGHELPQRPRIGGRARVIPPAGEGRRVERRARRRRVLEAVAQNRAGVEHAVRRGELREQRREVAEQIQLTGRDHAAELLGEHRGPLVHKRLLFRRRRGDGFGGDGFNRHGWRDGGGRRLDLGDPREPGGVGVLAVLLARASAARAPPAAREEEGHAIELRADDARLDVVVRAGPDLAHVFALKVGRTALARMRRQRGQPRA